MAVADEMRGESAVMVLVFESAVGRSRRRSGSARHHACEHKLGSASIDGEGKAGIGICIVKISMLQKVIEVCPSVCKAMGGGLGIENRRTRLRTLC